MSNRVVEYGNYSFPSYICPYLTCGDCNSIVFIDSNKLRFSLYNQQQQHHQRLVSETLTKCPDCKRTLSYHIGADDLSYLLKAKNAEEIIHRKKQKKKAIVKLQRYYRTYLERKYTRAKLQCILIEQMLFTRCANVIQSMMRMRLARRRIVTERSLNVIRYARPMLMERALALDDRNGNGNADVDVDVDVDVHENAHKNTTTKTNINAKVFWYKSKDELSILYENYYILVERLGFHPPLYQVEDNINLIAKRITNREHELVVRIQSKWRAMVVRTFVHVFQTEVIRIRERMVISAIRIQALFRGRLGRLGQETWKNEKWKKNVLMEYIEVTSQNRNRTKQVETRMKLKADFIQEMKQNQMMRYLKKIPWNSKMHT